MSADLLTTIQKELGYPELKKIDPNTQEIKNAGNVSLENKKAQALLPTTLAGIYRLAKSEEGLNEIAAANLLSNWVDIIFRDNKPDLMGHITAYALITADTAEFEMNKIAAKAIALVRENVKAIDDHSAIKSFMTSQRNYILPYIPAELHIGEFLNDPAIDDRTNKMEGPISSLMHKIESTFGGNETQEEADKKSPY